MLRISPPGVCLFGAAVYRSAPPPPVSPSSCAPHPILTRFTDVLSVCGPLLAGPRAARALVCCCKGDSLIRGYRTRPRPSGTLNGLSAPSPPPNPFLFTSPSHSHPYSSHLVYFSSPLPLSFPPSLGHLPAAMRFMDPSLFVPSGMLRARNAFERQPHPDPLPCMQASS